MASPYNYVDQKLNIAVSLFSTSGAGRSTRVHHGEWEKNKITLRQAFCSHMRDTWKAARNTKKKKSVNVSQRTDKTKVLK